MKLLFLITTFLTIQMLPASAQNTFSWDLNPYHNYSTYVDLQAVSKGVSIDDDFVRVSARNLSNYTISFSVKFTFTDFCGKSITEVWPGGLSLKSGQTDTEPLVINTKCKEFKKDGNSKTGIASVRAEITNFKNLTEEANKAKEKKDKELADKKDQEAAKEKERILNEEKTRQAGKSAPDNADTESGSYYSSQKNTPGSAEPKKPTWQETNARIQEEYRQKYIEQQERIAETKRVNQEVAEEVLNGAVEIAGMIGSIIKQGQEEKEKKLQYRKQQEMNAAAAQQAEIDRQKEAARRKELQLELRNSFFTEFPEGGVPLSSQKVPVSILYYFTYIFDKSTMTNDSPEIFLSNIFTVAQYGDGTWPFKSGIISDIQGLKINGTVTLVGYFTNRDLAEQMRNSFLDLARKSDFTVSNISYKSKSVVNTGGANDFWDAKETQIEGNAGKGKLLIGTPGVFRRETEEDFWETKKVPAAKAEPKSRTTDNFWDDEEKPSPSTTPKKDGEAEKAKPPIPAKDDDFWETSKPKQAPAKTDTPIKKPVKKSTNEKIFTTRDADLW